VTAHHGDHDTGARIGRTSATEQHIQTILTALLTAGIIASIGFAWRSSNTLERVATRQEEHVKTVDLVVRKLDGIDGRVDRIEIDMARFDALRAAREPQHPPTTEPKRQ
jgi:hypothetical protein